MGKATDASTVYNSTLFTSRGPAWHATRSVVDRKKYHETLLSLLQAQKNLQIEEQAIETISIDSDQQITGLTLYGGEHIKTSLVIATPGSFLEGLAVRGKETINPEITNTPLLKQMRELGFRTVLHRTGAPPIIDKNSVDKSKVKEIKWDGAPTPLSFVRSPADLTHLGEGDTIYSTPFTEKAKKIVSANTHEKPFQTLWGPTSCRSIESKLQLTDPSVKRSIFLENSNHENGYYLNGLATSLPRNIQEDFVRSLAGLENARFIEYGYSKVYSVLECRELYDTLESRRITGLFFAGQVIGISSYEEAAALGLFAGINGALQVRGAKEKFRSSSYMWSMVDTLTTNGTVEGVHSTAKPQSAEFRYAIRSNNADARLTKVGVAIGAIKDRERIFQFNARKQRMDQAWDLVSSLQMTPKVYIQNGLEAPRNGKSRSVAHLLGGQFDVDYFAKFFPQLQNLEDDAKSYIKSEAMYRFGLKRSVINKQM